MSKVKVRTKVGRIIEKELSEYTQEDLAELHAKSRNRIIFRQNRDFIKLALMQGATEKEVYTAIGIPEEVWKYRKSRDVEFRNMVNKAKQYLDMMAKKNVGEAIVDGDIGTSKWWLEKREFKTDIDIDARTVNYVIKVNGENTDGASPESGEDIQLQSTEQGSSSGA